VNCGILILFDCLQASRADTEGNMEPPMAMVPG
jgi:hypothetical protein